ncbi:cytidine deaminase [Chitinophaga pendula]|uniref:cytidine deaminase n=1 Tax=Chitinophaga TaxID=79328 RepID=UPI000BAE6D18|nr:MULTISPECIES: cytidine deaminase [Chitinophaga]ASZ11764.1 cytidine deaminase [Chitinophaga sp. MD30]UCJ05217.1 cytidine deaminase [Chitinophaga pendula]
MKKLQQVFEIDSYDDITMLPADDAALLTKARAVTSQAYAPYSRFHVGAILQLANGELVNGTNQENASYPAGICAERVGLSAAASLYPGVPVSVIAISYHNHNVEGASGRPISPCGICRQSLAEQQARQSSPIRLILSGQEGAIYVIPNAADLLPLSFSASDME